MAVFDIDKSKCTPRDTQTSAHTRHLLTVFERSQIWIDSGLSRGARRSHDGFDTGVQRIMASPYRPKGQHADFRNSRRPAPPRRVWTISNLVRAAWLWSGSAVGKTPNIQRRRVRAAGKRTQMTVTPPSRLGSGSGPQRIVCRSTRPRPLAQARPGALVQHPNGAFGEDWGWPDPGWEDSRFIRLTG